MVCVSGYLVSPLGLAPVPLTWFWPASVVLGGGVVRLPALQLSWCLCEHWGVLSWTARACRSQHALQAALCVHMVPGCTSKGLTLSYSLRLAIDLAH